MTVLNQMIMVTTLVMTFLMKTTLVMSQTIQVVPAVMEHRILCPTGSISGLLLRYRSALMLCTNSCSSGHGVVHGWRI